jgi:hypothetical protein
MRPKQTNKRQLAISQRLSDLQARAAAGEVFDLAQRPTWQIRFEGEHICTVAADFFYRVQRGTTEGQGGGVAEFVNVGNGAAHAMHKKLLHAFHRITARDVRV